ncbi:MAG: transposase [Actinomycetota bacterium]
MGDDRSDGEVGETNANVIDLAARGRFKPDVGKLACRRLASAHQRLGWTRAELAVALDRGCPSRSAKKPSQQGKLTVTKPAVTQPGGHDTRRLPQIHVTTDGAGIVSHAGSRLLAERLGLTAALSAAMAPTRKRRWAHDPSKVLVDLAVMLADGGDCLTDLAALRDQKAIFGRWPRAPPPGGSSTPSQSSSGRRSTGPALRPGHGPGRRGHVPSGS